MPATIAVLDGVPHVGLTAEQVDRVCGDTGLAKLGVRDLPVAAALGRRRAVFPADVLARGSYRRLAAAG